MVGKRILLVDDDESLVTTFKSILEKEGYSVETALTGKQALDKGKKTGFNLAILDIVLPDTRGDHLATRLKEQCHEISIIFITGYPSFKYCIDALEIGVHDILLKPIGPDELLSSTKEALSYSES